MTHRRAVLHDTHDAPTGTVIVICRQCGRPFTGYPTRHACPTDAQPTTFEAELLATRERLRQTLDLLDRVMFSPGYRPTAADLRAVREACVACGMAAWEWAR
jgi:hypothetical protein